MTREEDTSNGVNMKHSPAGGITAPLSRHLKEWVAWFEFCELTALVGFETIISTGKQLLPKWRLISNQFRLPS
jgi:hypothetical protein